MLPDETFNSASVIKIPVLVLAFQMADRGELKLDERITIRKVSIVPREKLPASAAAAKPGAPTPAKKPFLRRLWPF